MVRQTILTALLMLVFGCGGGQQPEPYQATLTEPWTEWALPTGEGLVQYSDDAMVTVAYPEGADLDSLKSRWGGALQAKGFEKKDDTSAAQMVSMTYRREGELVALGIVKMGDSLSLSLTRYAE